jgi:hypothetical protein
MPEALLRLLKTKSSELNAAIAFHRALAYAAPVALAAGLILAALKALGVAGPLFAVWALLAASGAAAGAIASRRSRMDEARTARWLDARLGDEEILGAALSCARREKPGRFDPAILEKADLLLPEAAAIKIPRRPMLKRSVIAAAALAIGAYAVFLSSYAQAGSSAVAKRAVSGAAGGESSSSSSLSQSLSEDGKAAADFAASLFPEDRRMANLVERALREGRFDDLAELLKSAGLELDSKLSRAVGEMERKKLTRQRESVDAASSALSMESRNSASQGKGRSGSRGGTAEDEESDSAGEDSQAPNARSGGSQGRGGEPGGAGEKSPQGGGDYASADRGGGMDGPEGAGGPGAGSKSSKGSLGMGQGSGDEADWGEITPLAGKEKATIPSSPDASFFELVLPGSGASAPISRLAPSSRKSAEAAMAREELPLEYEDFVKSYFITLSQGDTE